jgi:hypothetical protein
MTKWVRMSENDNGDEEDEEEEAEAEDQDGWLAADDEVDVVDNENEMDEETKMLRKKQLENRVNITSQVVCSTSACMGLPITDKRVQTEKKVGEYVRGWEVQTALDMLNDLCVHSLKEDKPVYLDAFAPGMFEDKSMEWWTRKGLPLSSLRCK